MKAQITEVKNDFAKTMEKMVDAANDAGAFARIYPVYQRLQTRRFQTQNASEGSTWPSLEQTYEQYKKKRYGGGPKRGGGNWRTFPGAGSKMLIGTSTLAGAVIGPGAPFVSEGVGLHRAKFTRTSMEIYVDTSGTNAEGKPFDYARFVAEKRPFMKFSQNSINTMKAELSKFILGKS